MPTHPISSSQEQILDRIRYFNRRYFNPFALSFAGRENSFWSVILHTGRRSGKPYTTPVVAVRQGERFIIPLPYGRRVDWIRNVIAAQGCTLIYRGKVYQASEPRLIPLAEGANAFPRWVENRLRRAGTEYLVCLDRLQSAPDCELLYRSFTESYPLARGLGALAAVLSLIAWLGWLIARRKR